MSAACGASSPVRWDTVVFEDPLVSEFVPGYCSFVFGFLSQSAVIITTGEGCPPPYRPVGSLLLLTSPSRSCLLRPTR